MEGYAIMANANCYPPFGSKLWSGCLPYHRSWQFLSFVIAAIVVAWWWLFTQWVQLPACKCGACTSHLQWVTSKLSSGEMLQIPFPTKLSKRRVMFHAIPVLKSASFSMQTWCTHTDAANFFVCKLCRRRHLSYVILVLDVQTSLESFALLNHHLLHLG